MNIIDKLGIKEIPEYYGDTFGNSDFVCRVKQVRKKEKLFNEMLEALIVDVFIVEPLAKRYKNTTGLLKKIAVIEKACYPKIWEEIKELYLRK